VGWQGAWRVRREYQQARSRSSSCGTSDCCRIATVLLSDHSQIWRSRKLDLDRSPSLAPEEEELAAWAVMSLSVCCVDGEQPRRPPR